MDNVEIRKRRSARSPAPSSLVTPSQQVNHGRDIQSRYSELSTSATIILTILFGILVFERNVLGLYVIHNPIIVATCYVLAELYPASHAYHQILQGLTLSFPFCASTLVFVVSIYKTISDYCPQAFSLIPRRLLPYTMSLGTTIMLMVFSLVFVSHHSQIIAQFPSGVFRVSFVLGALVYVGMVFYVESSVAAITRPCQR
ncbi:hypothetical protein GLAREA_10143 [Glarea lozoyensis ATCC 20868]|uniref:Uncharacterized protein n=1 Tax=Glarea lozoyensis (strain ATCC 20868 / MF5171) TaxID=1116229 RepID=S3DBF6_GLAL2|nr:uncharacterized protein GLAREA_10143 [Glarea lozoyensis ATCC 20868]EPE34449.1 hypothetical protein GLAREA_10143 [Glarea lozoyensis ATCC 20868]